MVDRDEPRTDLADYYERRAPHYDAVYAVPARQGCCCAGRPGP